jgi:hypothetical protein
MRKMWWVLLPVATLMLIGCGGGGEGSIDSSGKTKGDSNSQSGNATIIPTQKATSPISQPKPAAPKPGVPGRLGEPGDG